MSERVKRIIIILITVLVLLLIGIIVLINSSSFKEILIKKDLRSLSDDFYSIYYIESTRDTNPDEFLSQFKETGLNSTLANIKIFLKNRTDKDYEYKSLEKCDIDNTIIRIYPEEPYGKKDYELKFDISCK